MSLNFFVEKMSVSFEVSMFLHNELHFCPFCTYIIPKWIKEQFCVQLSLLNQFFFTYKHINYLRLKMKI